MQFAPHLSNKWMSLLSARPSPAESKPRRPLCVAGDRGGICCAVNAAITFSGTYRNIPYLTAADRAQNILFAAGLALFLFAIYFMATYAGSKRILKL